MFVIPLKTRLWSQWLACAVPQTRTEPRKLHHFTSRIALSSQRRSEKIKWIRTARRRLCWMPCRRCRRSSRRSRVPEQVIQSLRGPMCRCWCWCRGGRRMTRRFLLRRHGVRKEMVGAPLASWWEGAHHLVKVDRHVRKRVRRLRLRGFLGGQRGRVRGSRGERPVVPRSLTHRGERIGR